MVIGDFISNNRILHSEFTWTSSDTGVFTVETVDPEEGVMQITGISPGTAYLTISSEELGTRVVGVTVE